MIKSENNELLHHLQERHRRSNRYLRSLSAYSPGSSLTTTPVGSGENLNSTRLSQLETITEGIPSSRDRSTLSEPSRFPSSSRNPVQMRKRRPRLAKTMTLDNPLRVSVPQTKHSQKGGVNGKPFLRSVSLDVASEDAGPLLGEIPENTNAGEEKSDSLHDSDRQSTGESSEGTPSRSRRGMLSRQNKVRDISPTQKTFAREDASVKDTEVIPRDQDHDETKV